MKAGRGGAVAVWASSGMTTPDGQTLIDQEFYRQVSAGSATLGEAIRAPLTPRFYHSAPGDTLGIGLRVCARSGTSHLNSAPTVGWEGSESPKSSDESFSKVFKAT